MNTEDIIRELDIIGKKYQANKQKKSEIDSIDKKLKDNIKELMRAIPDDQKVMEVDKNDKSIQKHKVMKGFVLRRTINPPKRVINAKGKAKGEELLLETFAGSEQINEYYDDKEESDTLRVAKK